MLERIEKVRVAQQLVGPRGKSERDVASSAFPEIDSLGEEGKHRLHGCVKNSTL